MPSTSREKSRPISANWAKCSGAGLGARAGVEQHHRPAAELGSTTAIAGRITPGDAAHVERRRRQHGAGVARPTPPRSARPSPTRRHAIDTDDSGLARTARAPSSCGGDRRRGRGRPRCRRAGARPGAPARRVRRRSSPTRRTWIPSRAASIGPFDRGGRRVVAPHAVEGDRRLGRPTPRSRRPGDLGSSRRRRRRGAAAPGSRTGGSARGGSPRSRASRGACRGAAWRSFASERPRAHHRSEDSRKGSGPRAP